MMFEIQGTEYEYKYKGYEYRTFQDIEEDNIKTFHLCYKDGKEVSLCREFYNTSPYRYVKRLDFERYVDEYILVDFINS
jgi:hypothetical protein